MLMDLFIVPASGVINEKKATRTIHSCHEIIHSYWQAVNWKQINHTHKQSPFYGVIYDNEWFDPRLVWDLRSFLIYSRGIDMFSVFKARGDGKVVYEPRIFKKNLILNPDITKQPLPFDHEKLKFEKLIGGWLYTDA